MAQATKAISAKIKQIILIEIRFGCQHEPHFITAFCCWQVMIDFSGPIDGYNVISLLCLVFYECDQISMVSRYRSIARTKGVTGRVHYINRTINSVVELL
jgi:hypothetical protein